MHPWQLSYSEQTRMMLWAPMPLLLTVLALICTLFFNAQARPVVWKVLAAIAATMLLSQLYLALIWVAPEKYMGDTGRIMYAHVPQVWMMMLAVTVNLGASVAYLWKRSWGADSLAEASAEVGVLFGVVGVTLGSVWAKPTWGVWWDWDPRLVSVTVLLLIYAGYLALRRFIDDPEKRATFSAVVGIFSYVSIPLVWFSVRVMRSMHQRQSSPDTVDPAMTMVLRWSATAALALLAVFVYQRFLIAYAARQREVALPEALPPAQGAH